MAGIWYAAEAHAEPALVGASCLPSRRVGKRMGASGPCGRGRVSSCSFSQAPAWHIGVQPRKSVPEGGGLVVFVDFGPSGFTAAHSTRL